MRFPGAVDVLYQGGIAATKQPTYAALRASTLHTQAVVCDITGNLAQNDGGQGQFFWDSASTLADDGGTVLKPASVSGAGRWRRNFADNIYNVKWFGAVGDGVAD